MRRIGPDNRVFSITNIDCFFNGFKGATAHFAVIASSRQVLAIETPPGVDIEFAYEAGEPGHKVIPSLNGVNLKTTVAIDPAATKPVVTRFTLTDNRPEPHEPLGDRTADTEPQAWISPSFQRGEVTYGIFGRHGNNIECDCLETPGHDLE